MKMNVELGEELDNDELLSNNQIVSVDEALRRLNDCGKFQIRLLFVLCVAYVSCNFNMMMPVYLAPRLKEAWTNEMSPLKGELLGTLFFAGFLFGLLTLGPLADARGRRPIALLSLVGTMLFSCGTFAAPSYPILLATRLCAGFFTAGAFNCVIVLAMEFSPTAHRANVKAILSACWDITLLLFSVMSFVLKGYSWRTLAVVNLFILAAIGFCFRFMPESLRFLVINMRTDEAKQLLAYIGECNGTDDGQISLRFEKHLEKSSSSVHLWAPSLAKLSAVTGFSLFANLLTFYGLTFSTRVEVTHNIYRSSFFGATAELIGIIACAVFAERLGRRKSHVALNVILASSMLVLALPLASDAVVWTSSLIGRACSAGALTIGYLLASECFPTSCRSASVAWGSSCGRIGAMIAPLVADRTFGPVLFASVTACTAVAVGLVVPETVGLNLDAIASQSQLENSQADSQPPE